MALKKQRNTTIHFQKVLTIDQSYWQGALNKISESEKKEGTLRVKQEQEEQEQTRPTIKLQWSHVPGLVECPYRRNFQSLYYPSQSNAT